MAKSQLVWKKDILQLYKIYKRNLSPILWKNELNLNENALIFQKLNHRFHEKFVHNYSV